MSFINNIELALEKNIVTGKLCAARHRFCIFYSSDFYLGSIEDIPIHWELKEDYLIHSV